MKQILQLLITRHFYATMVSFAIFYYVFFAKGQSGFWDKVLIILIGLVLFAFYFFKKVATGGREHPVFTKKRGIIKIILDSIVVTFSLAIAEFFVLLLFFGKNPPVVVGIPYSVYSFTTGDILLIGLLYNIVFYSLVSLVMELVGREIS